MSSYENWRDRCRLAAAAATARGDDRSARYLGSLTNLSDDQVAGVCLVISANNQQSLMLTKNTDQLRREVAAHVKADSIIQGDYWDPEQQRGCFIGCLALGNYPDLNESTYGLPVEVQRIAERIFEALPATEAKAFFASLPDAVGCDGKDLTKVHWQFLASELRSLPGQATAIQAVIDWVIAGLELLAQGKDWPAAADAATAAATTWSAAAAAAASLAAAAADQAAVAAAAATAADAAAWSAAASSSSSSSSSSSTWSAAAAAARAAATARAAARLRQRDLLLRLIREAPVLEGSNG